MRRNRAMDQLLMGHRLDPDRPPPLASDLERLLAPGVTNQEGCWLLASQLCQSTADRRQFPDQTGFEAFVNHVHVLDVLGAEAERDPERSLGQGLALGRALKVLLAGRGRFQIVVATSIEAPADCNVRFYRWRPGEVWIEDDLEGYTHEGILVIDTEESPPLAHVH